MRFPRRSSVGETARHTFPFRIHPSHERTRRCAPTGVLVASSSIPLPRRACSALAFSPGEGGPLQRWMRSPDDPPYLPISYSSFPRAHTQVRPYRRICGVLVYPAPPPSLLGSCLLPRRRGTALAVDEVPPTLLRRGNAPTPRHTFPFRIRLSHGRTRRCAPTGVFVASSSIPLPRRACSALAFSPGEGGPL